MDESIEKDDRTLHAVHRHRAYISPSYSVRSLHPSAAHRMEGTRKGQAMDKYELGLGFGAAVMGAGMLIWDSAPIRGTVLCLISMVIIRRYAIRGGYWMW